MSQIQKKRFKCETNDNKITKTLINNKIIENSNKLSTNSLISDAPLHRLLPTTDAKLMASEQHKQLLIDNNIKVIKTKFTTEEKSILSRNWNQFCDEFNVDEDMKTRLLGFFALSNKYSKEERKKIRDFMRRENFLLRLAKDLPNRYIKHIYNKSRVMFCSLKRLNDISNEEKNQLKQLHKHFGNKWTKIGEKFHLYPQTIQRFIVEKYNKNGEPFNSNDWSRKEDKKLIKAIEQVLGTNELKDKIFVTNISWIKVQKISGLNRSGSQCFNHWNRKLKWKLANFDLLEDNWSKSDSSKLIYVLFKSNFDDECHIDWDYIKEKFINITSFNNLIRNWRIIKSTVPQFETKTYKEIINFLFDNFMPHFMRTSDDLRLLEEFYND